MRSITRWTGIEKQILRRYMMKKIKNVKYRVELSYKNSFVFDELAHAGHFMGIAVAHAEDPEDIERFEISPIVEYEDETEPVIYFDDNITEADKIKIKQQLNDEFGGCKLR